MNIQLNSSLLLEFAKLQLLNGFTIIINYSINLIIIILWHRRHLRAGVSLFFQTWRWWSFRCKLHLNFLLGWFQSTSMQNDHHLNNSISLSSALMIIIPDGDHDHQSGILLWWLTWWSGSGFIWSSSSPLPLILKLLTFWPQEFSKRKEWRWIIVMMIAGSSHEGSLRTRQSNDPESCPDDRHRADCNAW